MEYMYITNDIEIAKICDDIGIERVWVDLEQRGKALRQGGMDTVQSRHSIEDISHIKPALHRAKMQVRINPIYEGSGEEIDRVIDAGADIIMLPYYKKIQEVESFAEAVGGRTKTVLLLETVEAMEMLEKTLDIPGIDEIHIGLNDLHLEMGRKFMFELLSEGVVEDICDRIHNYAKSIPYGFGGIARVGQGSLPAELVLGEHIRLGSSRAILARSFYNYTGGSYDEARKAMDEGLSELRKWEEKLSSEGEEYFEANRQEVVRRVEEIVRG